MAPKHFWEWDLGVPQGASSSRAILGPAWHLGICPGPPWKGKAASLVGQGTASCLCVQPNGRWQRKGFGSAVGWQRSGRQERSVPPWQGCALMRSLPVLPLPLPHAAILRTAKSPFSFSLFRWLAEANKKPAAPAVLVGTVEACSPPQAGTLGWWIPQLEHHPIAMAPKHHRHSLQPNKIKSTLFLTGKQSSIRG